MMERSCGVILPVSCLPSPYGIGTMGKAAYEFIDFLAAAKQRWWQVLPLSPTGFGDSPYQSVSVFAGNPYFIDLDMLAADGLLRPEELTAADWGEDSERVDYGKLWENRFPILRLAASRGLPRDRAEVDAFAAENADWLADYAFFMALKQHFGMKSWTEWPDEVRMRDRAALEKYRALLADDIDFYIYIQFLFAKQWDAMHAYAKENGIGIIGDLPIYAALDSADVWAQPQFFSLDAQGFPTAVAGVPPDYFCEDGQLWGNPLYDWDAMRADGFGWWIRRIAAAAKRCDAIRIDHFRAFASYWAVPYGAETARGGTWVEGPGMQLLGVLNDWFPQLQYIAEDLGMLGPDVGALLNECGWPGMKVLQFAFAPQADSDYLPHKYSKKCICYTGTHDNQPLGAWCAEAPEDEREFASEYLGLPRGKNVGRLRRQLLRAGMASVANVFIAQMQDWLGTGADSRINSPGIPQGNWQWRLKRGRLRPALAAEMARWTQLYGRAPQNATDSDEQLQNSAAD